MISCFIFNNIFKSLFLKTTRKNRFVAKIVGVDGGNFGLICGQNLKAHLVCVYNIYSQNTDLTNR